MGVRAQNLSREGKCIKSSSSSCTSSTRGWPGKLLKLKMSYMKEKTTKPKSKKEIVLDGDNPQDYAEWETETKFKIKSKLGEIGLEHFHGRQNYTLSEERGENGKFVKIIDKTSERRAPSPLEADGPRLEHIADRTLMEHLFAQDKSTLAERARCACLC